MVGRKYGISEAKIQRWIKEGRGKGHKEDYKPWLTVRDISSEGRSHRVFGHKTQRTHHLFSDLELAVFLLLDWHPSTCDVREQFPLDRDKTAEISNEAGIKHPQSSGVSHVMTSDFLVNTSIKERKLFALQAKYTNALSDPRTIEKLEIERRYWKRSNVPWMLITEKEIPKIVFQNISWLYPAQDEQIKIEVIIVRADFYRKQFETNSKKRLIDICKLIDTAYELPAGESLREVRQLLAKRVFNFDITKQITKLTGADFIAEDINLMREVLNASNQ